MSSLNGISAMASSQPVTGGSSGATSFADSLRKRFGSTFSSSFNSTLATVFERGAAGDFDDRTLALQEQAALQRLRLAVQGGGGAPSDDGVIGANAAPAVPTDATAAQREVYAVRERQSEARLANISSSLRQEYPKAAQLVSASTGTWDPATFVPRSKEQAEAFAQRLVIDVTESAARLEIVKTQLDAARFDAAHGGGAATQQRVVELEAAYARQTAYVDKLAAIVDRQSGGMMTSVGVSAMGGATMRDADDLPVGEIVDALRADGYSDAQIARVVGSTESAVEEEKTPGGSIHLKQMASEMTRTLVNEFNAMVRRHEEEFQRQEREREDRRRVENKRLDRKRSDERSVEQAVEGRRLEQTRHEAAAAQRAAQRDAAFQQWIEALAIRHAHRDRTG